MRAGQARLGFLAANITQAKSGGITGSRGDEM